MVCINISEIPSSYSNKALTEINTLSFFIFDPPCMEIVSWSRMLGTIHSPYHCSPTILVGERQMISVEISNTKSERTELDIMISVFYIFGLRE